jgi:hypothetical protein
MDTQLALILVFTFVIHLIGTLAYAFRIAGIRTGNVAIAFSLFNVLVLVSRISNAFQGPFLAKRVETSLATLLGGLLIPTFQRYSTVAVAAFRRRRSVPRLMLRAATPRGLSVLVESASVPRLANLAQLRLGGSVPAGIVVLNVAATALWTVGVLASIYAGSLEPDFRVTAATLSALVNGVATILLFVVIDPYLSGLTDDVVDGRASEADFRRAIIWMVTSRLAGTLLAQALLLPAAWLIVWAARAI